MSVKTVFQSGMKTNYVSLHGVTSSSFINVAIFGLMHSHYLLDSLNNRLIVYFVISRNDNANYSYIKVSVAHEKTQDMLKFYIYILRFHI